MTHFVHGFIGSKDLLMSGVSTLRSARLFALAQDMVLLPMTDDLREELNLTDSETPETFEDLSKEVIRLGEKISSKGPVAYFETNYWGGLGSQSVIVWKEGKIIFGPTTTSTEVLSRHYLEGAVNQALRLIGVVRAENHDEFDTVGLAEERTISDWEKRVSIERNTL